VTSPSPLCYPPSDSLHHISSLPLFFFFNDTPTTEIYTLSLHDALPISSLQPKPKRHVKNASKSSMSSNAMHKQKKLMAQPFLPSWVKLKFSISSPIKSSTPNSKLISTAPNQ